MIDIDRLAREHTYYMVIFAAFISGISGVLIKNMSIPTTSMIGIRAATPILLLSGYLFYKGRPLLRSGWRTMLAASGINTIRLFLFFTAYVYTSIGNAIIVIYTWPIFATIMGAIFLQERLSRNKVLLLILSFLGILIVYMNPAQSLSIQNDDFLGITAALFCALFYAATIIMFKSQNKEYTPIETIFFQNLIPAIFYVPFLFFNTPIPTPLDWTLALTHGVVIGIIMFILLFYSLKYIEASRASIVSYLEILSAIFFGYIFIGESLSVNMIIGGGIILTASVLMKLDKS